MSRRRSRSRSSDGDSSFSSVGHVNIDRASPSRIRFSVDGENSSDLRRDSSQISANHYAQDDRDRADSNNSFALSHNSSQASIVTPEPRYGYSRRRLRSRADSTMLYRVDSQPRLKRGSPGLRERLHGRDRLLSTHRMPLGRDSDATSGGRDRGYSIESINAYRYPASPLVVGDKDDELVFADLEGHDRRDSSKSSAFADDSPGRGSSVGEDGDDDDDEDGAHRRSTHLDTELATRTRQWQAQRIAHFIAGIPGLKLRWHALVTVVILYNALFVPIRAAYPQHDLNAGWIIVDYLGDIVLWVDIYFNFKRPIVIKGDAITSRPVIVKTYMRGWFACDALASLPLDVFVWGSPNLHAALRLPRLLRLFRLFYYANKAEGYSQWVGASRLVKLFFVIALIIHLMSTLMHVISRSEHYVSHPDWLLWDNIHTQQIAVAYLRDYFWTMALLTGLGPDVNPPKSDLMFAFYWVSVVMGLLVVASIIANVGTVFTSFYAERTQWLTSMNKITTFMQRKDVPQNMQRKIRDHFQYIWSVHHGLDENHIMSKLPDHIRGDVAYHMHADLLKKVPIFAECHEEGFRRALCLHMKSHLYAPGDYVIRANEVGTRMFFIVKGLVEIIGPNGSVLAQRRTGQSFGENGLLYKGTRTASVRALSYCDMLSLSKDDLDDVLVDYPMYCDVIDQAADEQLMLLYGSREEFMLSEQDIAIMDDDVNTNRTNNDNSNAGGNRDGGATNGKEFPSSRPVSSGLLFPVAEDGSDTGTRTVDAAVDAAAVAGGGGGSAAAAGGGGEGREGQTGSKGRRIAISVNTGSAQVPPGLNSAGSSTASSFTLPTLNGMLRQTSTLRTTNVAELVAMQNTLLKLTEQVSTVLTDKVKSGGTG